MNEKFFDLKKEKQDRMINAALKVFALNGYRHASTDDIVREEAISKGFIILRTSWESMLLSMTTVCGICCWNFPQR